MSRATAPAHFFFFHFILFTQIYKYSTRSLMVMLARERGGSRVCWWWWCRARRETHSRRPPWHARPGGWVRYALHHSLAISTWGLADVLRDRTFGISPFWAPPLKNCGLI